MADKATTPAPEPKPTPTTTTVAYGAVASAGGLIIAGLCSLIYTLIHQFHTGNFDGSAYELPLVSVLTGVGIISPGLPSLKVGPLSRKDNPS